MADPAGSVDAALVRAARLTDEGKLRAAIAVLESTLEAYPDHSTLWCRLAAAYLDADEASESLDAAKRAIVLGERSWAHRLASLALVELDRHDEAIVSAREAVRRDPDDWRGFVTLAEALARDEPEQAVRAARAAVERAPTEPRTHEVLGDAAMLAHDWMLAEQCYRDALRLDPEHPDLPTKLARLAHRPADDPRRKRRPVRTRTDPAFGKAQRAAWYLAVRRAAVWQTVGLLALMVASKEPFLAWFGFGLVLFVGFLAWRGFVGLPPGARVPNLFRRAPLVVVSGVALGVSVLALLVWTVLMALGSVFTSVLVVAVFAALVAVANTWFGLWRIWAPAR